MPTQSAVDELVDLVERHHAAAARALREPDQALDAVAWVSTHLAAVDRVLYPALRRGNPNGRRLVRAQRSVDRRLLSTAWRLDRRLTGDVLNASLTLPALLEIALKHLTTHASGEQQLLAAAGLDDASGAAVLARLREATTRAPTRPHPLASRASGVALVAFRVDALVDAVRDALDARPVPVPRRRRRTHAPGRWGLYALGASQVPPEPELIPSQPGRSPSARPR